MFALGIIYTRVMLYTTYILRHKPLYCLFFGTIYLVFTEIIFVESVLKLFVP